MTLWQWFISASIAAVALALLVLTLTGRLGFDPIDKPRWRGNSARTLFSLGVAFALIGFATGPFTAPTFVGLGCFVLLFVAFIAQEVRMARAVRQGRHRPPW